MELVHVTGKGIQAAKTMKYFIRPHGEKGWNTPNNTFKTALSVITITNASISSVILPIKTIVVNRRNTVRHVDDNRISMMTEISKASHTEARILQIDTAIGQCPYQPK